jgi:hypothetical protein
MCTSYQSHRDDLHGSRRFQPLVQMEQITLRRQIKKYHLLEQITLRRDDTHHVPTVETVGYYANRPDGTGVIGIYLILINLLRTQINCFRSTIRNLESKTYD